MPAAWLVCRCPVNRHGAHAAVQSRGWVSLARAMAVGCPAARRAAVEWAAAAPSGGEAPAPDAAPDAAVGCSPSRPGPVSANGRGRRGGCGTVRGRPWRRPGPGPAWSVCPAVSPERQGRAAEGARCVPSAVAPGATPTSRAMWRLAARFPARAPSAPGVRPAGAPGAAHRGSARGGGHGRAPGGRRPAGAGRKRGGRPVPGGGGAKRGGRGTPGCPARRRVAELSGGRRTPQGA